jgi:hypothetical protein
MRFVNQLSILLSIWTIGASSRRNSGLCKRGLNLNQTADHQIRSPLAFRARQMGFRMLVQRIEVNSLDELRKLPSLFAFTEFNLQSDA